jgi:hypothetical protein
MPISKGVMNAYPLAKLLASGPTAGNPLGRALLRIRPLIRDFRACHAIPAIWQKRSKARSRHFFLAPFLLLDKGLPFWRLSVGGEKWPGGPPATPQVISPDKLVADDPPGHLVFEVARRP